MTEPRNPTAEELAVDYVLGELPPEEAAAFERRVADDPELAREVRRLRATLGLVPFATVTEPPAGLRGRVLAAAAERVRARAPRRVVWSRFAAAAAAALALAFGFDSYRVRRELSLERQLTATLHEPNVVRSFALAGAGGAYGTVALDLDAKRGAVVLKSSGSTRRGRSSRSSRYRSSPTPRRSRSSSSPRSRHRGPRRRRARR
ncbi:MAG: hypothetical protein E6J75_03510 [Deltaproteobacteria bacterium]|nr:MAG: hypothetical protein E6J75_03510 [Deltaproteobacteria bacterium]